METHSLLANYLSKIGLEPEAAHLYFVLFTHGPQSLLQLSRNARIERTCVYRQLDTLKDHYLIEEEIRYKRKIYRAAPLTNLEILLSKREQQLQSLETEMHHINKLVADSPIPLATCIQFYRGVDGIKQMLWNETKGQTENLSILHENMQGRTHLAFFERWVEKSNANKIRFRSIIDDNFIRTQQRWYTRNTNQRLRLWQPRFMSSHVYSITNSMVIYDDVVAWYDWQASEMFGIEVHNATIANNQRQFFEMLWRMCKPVKVSSDF